MHGPWAIIAFDTASCVAAQAPSLRPCQMLAATEVSSATFEQFGATTMVHACGNRSSRGARGSRTKPAPNPSCPSVQQHKSRSAFAAHLITLAGVLWWSTPQTAGSARPQPEPRRRQLSSLSAMQGPRTNQRFNAQQHAPSTESAFPPCLISCPGVLRRSLVPQ
jgi:hypothetical protein